MADQAGDCQAERARVEKMREENERLKYRIKILETALADDNKTKS